MPRRATRIPKDLKFRQIHAVCNHNDRHRGSIGEKTLQIIMDTGCMYVEDYVDICESNDISPAQAIKELRVDLGFQRVALENFPEFVDPFFDEEEEEEKKQDIPSNIQAMENALKNKEQSLDAREQDIERKKQTADRLIQQNLERQDELNQQDKVNNEIFAEAQRLLDEAKEGVECGATIADPKNNNGLVHPPEWDKLVKLAKIGHNIMLTGPTGCGKTHVCRMLAEHLDRKFGFISCSSGISESEFRGRIIPNISNGTTNYIPSIFIKFYENGGILLLDELDAADGNTIIFINTALANDEMYIDIREDDPLVKRHKDFVCIAAANTFGHGADEDYTERNMLDMATLDRFRAGIVEMNYSKQVEEQLVNKHVLDWGWKIRELIKTHSYNHAMSTRVMIDLSKQADTYNWGRKEWEKVYFADWDEDERRIAQNAGVMLGALN